MHARSKGYRRFKDRLDNFQEDLEIIAIVYNNRESLAGQDTIFQGVSENGQPKLKRRNNSPASRKLVVQHLRKTLYVSFIKDLYEEVLIYCQYALGQAASHVADATRLIGDQNNQTFKINEILSKSTKDEIFSMVTDKIFRAIEKKKDTLELVTALNERINLGIESAIFDKAMPYLEARHLFIHADGLTDQEFREKYPNVKLTDDYYIKLNPTIIKEAQVAIHNLVLAYDQKLTDNSYIDIDEYR